MTVTVKVEDKEGLLARLEEAISKSDDQSAECVLEDYGFDYEEIVEDDWSDDGKYQHRCSVFKIEGRYFQFPESRSGSHFTDWYHSIYEVEEVQKFEGSTKVTVDLSPDDCYNSLTDYLDANKIEYSVEETEAWK